MRIKIILFLFIMTLFSPFRSFGADMVKIVYDKALYADAAGKGMKRPEGVACDGKSFVVVADTGNGRFLKFSRDDGSLKGGEEIKIKEAPYPLRVQISSKDEILALDGKSRKIVRIGSDGAFKGYVGPAESPTVGAFVPKAFRIDKDDNVYVLDIFSGRVMMLDPSGSYKGQIDFPDKGGFFSDLAVDLKGTVFLLDSANAVVYFAQRGAKSFSSLTTKLEEYMNFPSSLIVDSRDVLYLSDQNGSAVVIVGPDGAFQGRLIGYGWKEGLLRYPAQLCIDESSSKLFVADRENSRIQLFNILK